MKRAQNGKEKDFQEGPKLRWNPTGKMKQGIQKRP